MKPDAKLGADLHVRVPPELLARIDEMAGRTRRTRGDTVRLLLEEMLRLIDEMRAKREVKQAS